jgi:hypothetical protein
MSILPSPLSVVLIMLAFVLNETSHDAAIVVCSLVVLWELILMFVSVEEN